MHLSSAPLILAIAAIVLHPPRVSGAPRPLRADKLARRAENGPFTVPLTAHVMPDVQDYIFGFSVEVSIASDALAGGQPPFSLAVDSGSSKV